MTTSDDRAKALEGALAQINKTYDKGSIYKLGEAPKVDVDVLSSGSLAIDIATGIGGFPRGRIIEVWGQESSGKTSLTLRAIAMAQRAGGTAAFIDAEHALDPSWAEKLGVNINDLVMAQPDNGEQALSILEVLVRSGAVDIVVVDSVAALVPQKELDGEIGDAQMGAQARMMSQALRKITGAVKKTNTTVIFINQVRQKIGVVFGSPNTTTGGNSLKFYASIRMEIARIGAVKVGENIVGAQTKVKVVKNKVGRPYQTAEYDILYDEGFSLESDILKLGEKAGIIRKSGSYYSYSRDGQNIALGQGAEKSRLFLKEPEQIELRNELEQLIREKYLGTGDAKLDTIPADASQEG